MDFLHAALSAYDPSNLLMGFLLGFVVGILLHYFLYSFALLLLAGALFAQAVHVMGWTQSSWLDVGEIVHRVGVQFWHQLSPLAKIVLVATPWTLAVTAGALLGFLFFRRW